MSVTITAVYERGVLRPLQPMDLQEHQTVRLQVLPEISDDVERVIHALIEDGLLTPPLGHSEIPPPSEEERRQLAKTLARMPGKPPSEIIIEERGEW